MTQLLSGLKILDLSRLLPGPFCTLLLADQGADVIKVEDLAVGDYARFTEPIVGSTSLFFEMLNRGKRSIALNLKNEAGRQIFMQLAAQADVVLESFRPGRVERLGVGYEEVRAVNPQIIYCSLSGYGQTGPRRLRAGHDINYIALAGLLGLNRRAGEMPVVPGVQIADLSGGLFATVGILAALRARDATGQGQYVDVSMFDGVLSWMVTALAPFLAGQSVENSVQALLSGQVPCYNVYETADGRYMSLGALEPHFWRQFCQTVERPDLEDAAFEPAMCETVQAIFRERTQAEWVKLFQDVDVCCEPVLSLAEVLEEPQTWARNMVVETHHPTAGPLRQLGPPIKFSDAVADVDRPAPALGQHSEEILRDLGYQDDEIVALREQRVIR